MMINFLGMRQAVDERYRAFPIHLYGFNRRTLARLLSKNDFTVVKVTSFDVGVHIGQTKCVGNIKSSPSSKTSDGAAAGRKFSLKNMLKKMFFSLYLGERLIIVARPTKTGETANV
jgi:hypothetical protein